MGITQLKHKLVIEEFKRLLLISSCDFDARTMHKEAGKVVFLSPRQARRIISAYYSGAITEDMITFLNSVSLKNDKNRTGKEISMFSEKFNVCLREARIYVTYIKRRGL